LNQAAGPNPLRFFVKLPPYTLIATPSAWQECLAQLRREPRLALDLEANSMHAYREQICLIQISIPARDYIVDPLAQLDLTGLGEIVVDPAVEKIFHAAEYDLILMKREYGWQLRNLFDTMWASRILGVARVGLASILEDLYQVQLNKRLQKANWCKRPLPTDYLDYAQCDTHYLLSLRDHLADELQARGHWEEALETFAEQTQVSPADQEFNPEGFWSIHGATDLTGRQQAILQALYLFRDKEAHRRDLPLFKIFGDKTLLEIAQASPRQVEELKQVTGMSPGLIRRYGRQLIQVVRQGKLAPPPPYPARHKRLPPAVLERYDRLHTWRKERAARRGVESDVILSRGAMWALAQAAPRTIADLQAIPELGDWRRRAYGAELINLLQ
jgi:ribonuclease D